MNYIVSSGSAACRRPGKLMESFLSSTFALWCNAAAHLRLVSITRRNTWLAATAAAAAAAAALLLQTAVYKLKTYIVPVFFYTSLIPPRLSLLLFLLVCVCVCLRASLYINVLLDRYRFLQHPDAQKPQLLLKIARKTIAAWQSSRSRLAERYFNRYHCEPKNVTLLIFK